MKFTTLLPLADNKGTSHADKIDAIVQSLAIQFGGCSREGVVEGHSIDSGVQYRDQSLRVTVVCENSRLDEARDRIIEIGRELGQRAMYFEVRDFDGVQILRID